jgi:KaiC/GvpD/RAD55 family RecA-like ATPase
VTKPDCLSAALSALGLGLRPIPIGPDKKPLVKWEVFQQRAPTEAEVQEWWRKFPNASVGVLTGTEDGVTVIDFDPGHEPFPKEDYEMPVGCIVSTPRGGKHYYVKHVQRIRNSASKLAKGVDVRSEGGYVIIPPSVINGKQYSYELGSLKEALSTEAPAWLVSALRSSAKKKPEKIPGRIAEGARNATLASLAGTMRRRGASEDAIEQALLAENQKCSPPLPVEEVKAIAHSVARYSPAEEIQLETFLMPQVKETLLASLRKPEIIIPTGFEGFDNKLGGVKELVVLLGEPKIGKSTFALQISVSAAKAGVGVLYFDTENGTVNLGKRIVCATYNVEEKMITEEDVIAWDISRLGTLAIVDDRRMMMGAGITSLVDKIRTRAPGKVLCIFDSLQKLPHDLGDRRAGIDFWLRFFEQLKKQEVGILLVSEVNRAGYNRQQGMQAGKESGDIEYSADVLLRLSPKGKRTSLYSLEVVTSRYHEHGVVGIYGLTKFRRFVENPDQSFDAIRFGSGDGSVENFVRNYLREHPEEKLFISTIAEETEENESAVGKALAKMRDVKIRTDQDSRRRYVVSQ